jgi:thiamine pyrophosphate-dependent acetolactate synthase large subunit-like protein
LKTRLSHVDIDSQVIGRNCPPTLGMVADVTSVQPNGRLV